MYNTNSYRPVKYESDEWAAIDISQKYLDFVSGEICNLRETLLVVSHLIYCSAPIALKSVWTIKCLVFQTDHWETWMVLIVLDALQPLNEDMLFLISLFHCFTLHMFHWGMALVLQFNHESWEEREVSVLTS